MEFKSPIFTRVLAYFLDLILVLFITMLLLSVWVLPRYFDEPIRLLQQIQESGIGFSGATLQALNVEQQEQIRTMGLAVQAFALVVLFAYFFISESVSCGSSIGKRIFRLHVIRKGSLGFLGFFDTALRSFFTALCLLTLPILLLNFFWGLLRKDHRCWHDLMFKSCVIEC